MDYSDCPKNFTIDQTTAMRNALASVVSNRQNLWQTSNLNFTNVNGANNFPPIAEFMSTYDTYTVCVGGTLQFKDFSYNGTITGYQWAANDAIIGAPTSSNANITFTAAGISTVSLTVSNTFGSNVKQRVVTVVDNTAGIFGPHFESFEDPGIPIDWHVYDGNNDGLTWAQTPAASYDGAYSFVMENATNPPNSIDILEMPIMDVLNNQGNVFSFAYAYRQKTAGVSDMLRIQASKDCGGTWNDIYALNSSVMQAGSGGISADPYYPMDPSEWKTYVISSHPAWNSYKTSSSVMVRFLFQENSAGNGNNLYVDAINFFPPTGVNELSNMIRYSVYPNPSNDVTNVSFSLHDAAKVKIEVLDVLGKSVMEPIEGSYSQGDHSVVINNNLPTGIYFVNLSLNGAKVSTKLIVE